MNIREREQYLEAIRQWEALLSNTDFLEKIKIKEKDNYILSSEKFKFDWTTLTKPPISYYLPQNVIWDLEGVSNSIKLMNNPSKRFKIQNDILKPYGFYPLNSGTNRRTFYHEKDSSIVLKLGSDKIGKSDNIAEYSLQYILAPFCTKVFDVTPSGSCAIVERVDTMTKEQFNNTWSQDVFNLLISLYYRGFIIEDVGSNFFKNWGIRLGFGLVLLDYPYIYEVDYSKLRCDRRDPFTNVVCGGEIDYDYIGGMNQLICEKCGARYPAKHLAKKVPSTFYNPIIRKKEYSMGLMNTNIKVYTTAKNLKTGETKVLHRYYNESEYRQEVLVRNDRPYVDKSVKQQLRRDERNNNAYPFSVRKDLNEFLCNMEKKYGKRIAVDMAKKLNFRYEHERREEQKPKEESGEDNSSPSLSLQDKAQKFKNMNISSTVLKEVEAKPTEDTPKPDVSNRPTTGLYPMKPKSAEEIEQEELKERNETAVMGFLGESGVEKIKRMEMMPRIKSMTIAKFNGFEGNSNDDELGNKLANNVKDFIKDDILNLLGNIDGLKVECQKINDNLNRICYRTMVTNYGSILFDCLLYTKEELENTNKQDNSVNHIKELLMPDLTKDAPIESDKKISDSLPMTENELRVFFEDEAINFDFDKYPTRNKELQLALEQFLVSKLLDRVTTVPFPLAQRKASEYVKTYYPEDTEDLSNEL